MVNRMSPPADFSLEHDAFGRLVLTMPDGQRHVGVHPVRGFPHFRSAPRAGGVQRRWPGAGVDRRTRSTFAGGAHHAGNRTSISGNFCPSSSGFIACRCKPTRANGKWKPIAGRQSSCSKAKTTCDGWKGTGALVTDAHGIRYLIANSETLDRHSRRVLERYL